MHARHLLDRAVDALLSRRTQAGIWEGHLSSSALSTATAVTALALYDQARRAAGRKGPPYGDETCTGDAQLVRHGIDWLLAHRNPDGGWGDTIASASNISTTMLVWAALAFAPDSARAREAELGATAWIRRAAGGLDADRLAAAIGARYGRDRTFSVPILTMCALAGRLGSGPDAWRAVPPLPFELAAAPHRLFAWLRLPVVSYALPALIAMGLVRHRRLPSRNPAARAARALASGRVLTVLETLQPANGGFLEATPLTSFVAMSLIGAGEARHPVVCRALDFLRSSARTDGSWPIDTNLSTWVTTLAVNALAVSERLSHLDRSASAALSRWLVSQQHTAEHAYTGASPGGWAWTPLPGGVPDADDTAGAVLALARLPADDVTTRSAAAGIRWLLGLQNRDGGIPTFCRGWGTLPFDRSGADLTGHAIRAWAAWIDRLDPTLQRQVQPAIAAALAFLSRAQQSDGSFLPLWFGNESAPGEANPTYGTARVIPALAAMRAQAAVRIEPMLTNAMHWLLAAQNDDGGWGGSHGVPSSIEETALTVGALTHCVDSADSTVRHAIERGCQWLVEATAGGVSFPARPIGLYFAKLWYSEELYPLLFCVEGIGRAVRYL